MLAYLKGIGIEGSFHGDENTEIKGFSSLKNYKMGTITWVKKQETIPEKLDQSKVVFAIVSPSVKGDFKNIFTTSDSKYAFFSILEHFFDTHKEEKPPVGQYTYIGPNVVVGKGTIIGHNCTLDGNIEIGDNTEIWNNVTIINDVVIGNSTVIQSGCVIGHDGFGFTENEKKEKTMVKHFGGVRIGNNVLVGSNVCIARGTIDDTVVSDGTKIDNLSHIAHNCILGENTALAFPCALGGSSVIKDNGYIAGGIIRNQCTVYENAFVGMGAVVTKDVPANTIVIGNPAREYKKL